MRFPVCYDLIVYNVAHYWAINALVTTGIQRQFCLRASSTSVWRNQRCYIYEPPTLSVFFHGQQASRCLAASFELRWLKGAAIY